MFGKRIGEMEMTHLRKFFTTFAILLALAGFGTGSALAKQAGGSVGDASKAVAQIRENADRVLEILRKDDGANSQEVRKEAEEYAKPYFDFTRMTILAVGRPWRKASQDQKKRLTDAFRDMLIGMYSGTMLQFKDTSVVVKDKAIVTNNGREVTVKSELTPATGPFAGKVFNVDYKLFNSDDKYRIYDVIVNGISLVVPYRTEFAATIQKEGFDGLITKLNEGKITTLDPMVNVAQKSN